MVEVFAAVTLAAALLAARSLYLLAKGLLARDRSEAMHAAKALLLIAGGWVLAVIVISALEDALAFLTLGAAILVALNLYRLGRGLVRRESPESRSAVRALGLIVLGWVLTGGAIEAGGWMVFLSSGFAFWLGGHSAHQPIRAGETAL